MWGSGVRSVFIMPQSLKPVIPWAFVWFRGLCGLAPWLCYLFGWSMWVPAMLIPAALLSDIYDGILARRWNVVSVLLRRADGWADLVFVLSYTAFALIFRSEMLAPYLWAIIALGLCKGASTAHDFMRYGRGAAFHFWSAKLWALPYYAVLFELLIGHEPLWFFWPTIVMGMVAISEEFIAVRLIPVWMQDQPNVFAAVKAYRSTD